MDLKAKFRRWSNCIKYFAADYDAACVHGKEHEATVFVEALVYEFWSLAAALDEGSTIAS